MAEAEVVQVNEIKGDLFASSPSASLAHCVSKDLHMGKGIATVFKKKFGGVDELKSQGVEVGGCGVLTRNDRYIYYLVSKPRFFHKPKYPDLRSSLEAMRDHVVKNGVKELCMPRIGCGLDGLNWDKVRKILGEVFTGTDVHLAVYYL